MLLSAHTTADARPSHRALVSWKSLCPQGDHRVELAGPARGNHRSGQRRQEDDDGDHDERDGIVRTDAVEQAGQSTTVAVPIIVPGMRPVPVIIRLLLMTSRTSLPGDAPAAARMGSSLRRSATALASVPKRPTMARAKVSTAKLAAGTARRRRSAIEPATWSARVRTSGTGSDGSRVRMMSRTVGARTSDPPVVRTTRCDTPVGTRCHGTYTDPARGAASPSYFTSSTTAMTGDSPREMTRTSTPYGIERR